MPGANENRTQRKLRKSLACIRNDLDRLRVKVVTLQGLLLSPKQSKKKRAIIQQLPEEVYNRPQPVRVNNRNNIHPNYAAIPPPPSSGAGPSSVAGPSAAGPSANSNGGYAAALAAIPDSMRQRAQAAFANLSMPYQVGDILYGYTNDYNHGQAKIQLNRYPLKAVFVQVAKILPQTIVFNWMSLRRHGLYTVPSQITTTEAHRCRKATAPDRYTPIYHQGYHSQESLTIWKGEPMKRGYGDPRLYVKLYTREASRYSSVKDNNTR
jgi:hypothetical protein